MKVVSDNKDFAERRCRRRVENALRQLTANLLRVTRGAGRSWEIFDQAVAFLEACQEYHAQVGSSPSFAFFEMLDTAPDPDWPNFNHAVHTIVCGALQMTAARLLGQKTQERTGEKELHAGIERREQAVAEEHKQFARAQQTAAADQAARRRSERLFLIDPLRPPALLDEGLWKGLGEAPRSAEELTAAEGRLRELGFALTADGNVMAWKYRQEPYTVLADPRVRGRLRFCVYDEARLAAASRRRHRQSDVKSVAIDAAFRPGPLVLEFDLREFYLRDSWRHDIVGKFRTRLRAAIAARDRDGGASDRRNE